MHFSVWKVLSASHLGSKIALLKHGMIHSLMKDASSLGTKRDALMIYLRLAVLLYEKVETQTLIQEKISNNFTQS